MLKCGVILCIVIKIHKCVCMLVYWGFKIYVKTEDIFTMSLSLYNGQC